MAQVVLGAVGGALGGPIGAALGGVAGALADRAAIGLLTPAARRGPRLEGLRITGTADGAPMAAVFGRSRVSGQVIWAARFTETLETSGGGKRGPKVEQASYGLSMAVGLCEGPIDGVGRVWADGKPLDLSSVTMRVHKGGAEQTPDPLIEAVEGSAPAYRGTAYVVFEDLPLGPFGNRPPQLSFEVFKGSGAVLEERLTGVCMIPGAGEFVYSRQAVVRKTGLASVAEENVTTAEGRPDLLVALDQLQARFPNCTRVTLVISWFGDDLRAGVCQVRPGVERHDKVTLPIEWRVAGIAREDAYEISRIDGAPAYGGTPSDQTVVEAIAELKARGFQVGLYPFLMMDVPADNELPDPHGGKAQAPFPWRGRISCHPAPGRPGSPDGTSVADDEVGAFFDRWRTMVLHYADLAASAGGVDTFLVGSEFRGLTTVRGAAGYPAAGALVGLVEDCRGALGPDVAISYAADWSEYFGHQPADGSGDVAFHLDPLWSHADVDFVGIDWYAPLSDWRDGDDHLDALAGFKGPRDVAYLSARVRGGEGFDWWYPSPEAREAQDRAPITDGAYGEPWIYRFKDLAAWWSHAHHDRPGGVRSVAATGWVPGSKPIRFTEFGCPAVDKGANSPNLFIDPKSSESFLPPYSSGVRDDQAQRAALEALLTFYGEDANNPAAPTYGGRMLEGMDAWCWDARPFPAFPARGDKWKDAANWTLGHWLNGRASGTAVSTLEAILRRAGLTPDDYDLSGVDGAVTGYVIDRPMSVRDSLGPVLEALDLEAGERGGKIGFVARGDVGAAVALDGDDLAMPDARGPRSRSRVLEPQPQTVRLCFIDDAADYQTGAVTVRRDEAVDGGGVDLDLPVVATAPEAEVVARRALLRRESAREALTLWVSPLAALRLEPGDLVAAADGEGRWRVRRVELDEAPRVVLAPVTPAPGDPVGEVDWGASAPAEPVAPPLLQVMDLPPLPFAETDERPVVAALSDPWRALRVRAGPSAGAATERARLARPTPMGVLVDALPPGPLHRWDRAATARVRIEGGTLQSRTVLEVLAGGNRLAVLGANGEWEVLHFRFAELVAPGTWRISRLLRGTCGTRAMGAVAGAAVVVLGPDVARAEVQAGERGLPLTWIASASGTDVGATTVNATWRGLHRRPWSPAHLRARRTGSGDVALSRVPRLRLGGDVWDGPVPFPETVERYRVEVLDAETVVRAWEVGAASAVYAVEDLEADFPDGTETLTVRVAQGSDGWGWGVAAQRTL